MYIRPSWSYEGVYRNEVTVVLHNLGIKDRQVVSFTLRSLCLRYASSRSSGGAQNRSGRFRVEKISSYQDCKHYRNTANSMSIVGMHFLRPTYMAETCSCIPTVLLGKI